MGSNSIVDSNAADDEYPQRQVLVNSFWIDRTEITNAQFVIFLNVQGNQKVGGVTWLEIDDPDVLIEFDGNNFLPKVGFADYPVNNVSWYGANYYCQWIGGSLPTEAQWEYAARGNDGRIYPWGDQRPTCDLAQIGVCGLGKVGGASPAGDSWVGAVDMAGNVMEWSSDWYDADYYEIGLTNNPSGPESGQTKVLRGGGWNFGLQFARVASRYNNYPDFRHFSTGFRCLIPAR